MVGPPDLDADISARFIRSIGSGGHSVTTNAYRQIIAAHPHDRLDLFLATANRLGTPVGNIEKDFWVCWTLDALDHRLPEGGPKLP
jgi:hypothetical protein